MKKNGSVLVIVLWVLALLVLFALGLGHRTAISLRITKNQRDRLVAASIARSGVQYVIAILNNGFPDAKPEAFDTLESCGVNLKGRSAQEVFTKVWDGGRVNFKIGYTIFPDASGYGTTDEERRININGFAGIDKNILIVELFKAKDVADAEALASWISVWVVNNNAQLLVPEELQGLFEYYYVSKNTAPEEARRKARAAYVNIQDSITVFGEKLNINTASGDALRILSRAIASANGITPEKAEALASDILSARDARNQKAFTSTADLDSVSSGFINEKKQFFDRLKGYLCIASNFFRIESLADVGGAKKSLTVIYDRKQGSIVYRHEI